MIGKHFRRRAAGLDRHHHDAPSRGPRSCSSSTSRRSANSGGEPHRASAALSFKRGAIWPPRPEARLRVLHGRDGRPARHPARPDRHRAWTRSCTAPATRRRRPSRRWTMSRCCSPRPARSLSDVVKATVYVTDRAFLDRGERDRPAPPRRRQRPPSPPSS